MTPLALYIDTARPGGQACLLDGLSGSLRSAPLTLMQGDRFPIRVYLRAVTNGIAALSTAVAPAEGNTAVLAAKATPAGAVVFGAALAPVTPETGDAYYEATLDLATTELATALGAAPVLMVYADLEIQGPGNLTRLSYRLQFRVAAQIYDTELTPPTPAATAGVFAGVLKAKSADTDLWHALVLRTVDGNTFLAPEQEGTEIP
jgi:hypothetical protein